MNKKRIIVISAVILTVIGALVIGLVAGRNSESDEASVSWQEQYDLGVRYLSEGNYEEAIIAFTAAIEIDPKQADAYVQLANVYIGIGDIADATDVLYKALEHCDDLTSVSDLLAQLESGKFSYNLTLTDVRYEFDSESEVAALSGNEGAIGGVSVEFTVVEPDDVAYADIEAISDLMWLEDIIKDMLEFGRGVSPMVGTSDWGIAIPIFDDISEMSQYIVVVAFDSNYDFVGYSVIGNIRIGNEAADTAVNSSISSNEARIIAVPTRSGLISTSGWHTIGVLSDGTVIATGNNEDGQCSVDDWSNIVAVSAGFSHSVGLRADGTVVATGSNERGQCDVAEWSNIVAISAGFDHTVGLKADGTVVAVGNNDNGECNVSDWTNIVGIEAGGAHTIGLRNDGTAIAVGRNNEGQCDVGVWSDLVAVSGGFWNTTVGLFSDGSAIAIGKNDDGQCDVANWSNIVAIDTQGWHTVGLKSDGTVVAVGSNATGRLDVSEWTDIVAISAGNGNTIGLRADGTAVATRSIDNDLGACDVEGWTNLLVPDELKIADISGSGGSY